LYNVLINNGVKEDEIHFMGKGHTISLPYDENDTSSIKLVITIPSYSMGYSMSKFSIMITSVYYDNQATREQLEGRLNDLLQPKDEIHILTLHSGLLTYTLDKHHSAASLSAAMKQFADQIK
jgi:hypothetical protein